eukprot:CAMPEP_0201596468 /NCGR_PEP_ID=MMETSP0190_2-20130828/193145_1 /ASSEMBLY_ACC=CAM_ASM_000263 /TAXON_ID=37353 /ORGANISM="Rosalina sp." /LENGTH=200 /DNA_ID=CAMNT_0048056833 /DNA_START=32 /DNA_END=634 /DNA_ORIENTATION=+
MTTYDWVVANEKKIKEKQNKKLSQKGNKYAKKQEGHMKEEQDELETEENTNTDDIDEDEDKDESMSIININALTNDEEKEKQSNSNQNIKAQIISKSSKNIKRGFRKYFYSLRDCEYKFHRKNIRKDNKKLPDPDKQGLNLNTNADVQLSGLTTEDTLKTQEASRSLTTDTDIICSINICHCIGNGQLRKSNTIHVAQKY